MCEECHMFTCPSGCPNAPEPPHIHCELCNQEIYDDDYYYDIDDLKICGDCVNREYRLTYNSEN